MKNPYMQSVACGFWLTCYLFTNAVAEPYVDPANEFTICANPQNQYYSAIYGDVVVWTDYRSGDSDIYGADISDPQNPVEFPICTYSGSQYFPAIYDSIVVWMDHRTGGSANVYGADISDPQNPVEFPICTHSVGQNYPVISGDIVVWYDFRNGNADIFGADISDRNNPVEFPISTNPIDQYSPSIYGNIVVWTNVRHLSDDIYGADISDRNNPIEFPVCTRYERQTDPVIHGDIVVWNDYRNGNTDIYATDISDPYNPVEFPVCTNPAAQYHPAIYGSIVVWDDYRNGTRDIYAADTSDPQNRVEFPVSISASGLYGPAIYRDVIVWDDRFSNDDIHGNRILGLPGPPGPTGVTIRGTVYDALTMDVLPDVQVKVGKKKIDTDSNGKYILDGLPTGKIKITAEKDGYDDEAQTLPYTLSACTEPWTESPYYGVDDGIFFLCDGLTCDIELYMAPKACTTADSGFRPITNGFHFKNEPVFYQPPFPPMLGYCAGMSYAASDLWRDNTLPYSKSDSTNNRGWPIPDDDQSLLIKNINGEVALSSTWQAILDYLFLSPTSIDNLDMRALKLCLRDEPLPIVLGSLFLGLPSGHHCVLAYRLVRDKETCRVWIYDNNKPEKESVITLIKKTGLRGRTFWVMETYDGNWERLKLMFSTEKPGSETEAAEPEFDSPVAEEHVTDLDEAIDMAFYECIEAEEAADSMPLPDSPSTDEDDDSDVPEEDVPDRDEEPPPTDDDPVDTGDDEAIGVEEAVAFTLSEAAEIINELGPENFSNEGSATALTNEIDVALALIDDGMLTEALYVLENDILARTNGCADTGEPDENDWITTYEGQVEVYPLIVEAIELLESLIQ